MPYNHTPPELTQNTLQRGDCPLHYWTGGPADAPVVFMLHGATMDHRMFNDQVAALVSRFRIIVWDAPGHGQSLPPNGAISLESYATDALALLDAQHIEQVALVGQSLGAYITQHIYARTPGRVSAMVVIGSTPLNKAYSHWKVWSLKASLPLFAVWPYQHFTRTAANASALREPVRAYALEVMRAIPPGTFRNIWRAVSVAIATYERPKFHVEPPLLLMHGDQDKTGTIQQDMPTWAQAAPGAEYHVIPDASHNANQDNPAAVNALLLDFLERHLLI